MDTDIEIVKMFMNALEANEFETAIEYLAADFLFSGWTPQPLNKEGFMAVIEGLKDGMPGLIFNLHNVQDEENHVTGTLHITGYQTNSFALPQLNLPHIPQMARSVSLPTEDVEYSLENGQIESMRVQQVTDGGLKGLLHQLGTDTSL